MGVPAIERALIVGAGGLGCPALWALAEAGVPHVTIMDPDRIEPSNLHRQILYTPEDVGQPKAPVAADAVRRWFPEVRIVPEVEAFRPSVTSILEDHDIVLDATDHIAVKRSLHDACRRAAVDYVFAAAQGWSGQVMPVRADAGPCLRCAFPREADAAQPTCELDGVLGPVLGRVAARQVLVALEDDPQPSLHQFDGRTDTWLSLGVPARADCPICRSEAVLAGPEVSIDDGEATQLDLRGGRCPDTFIRTRRRLESLPPGSRLWVVFDSDESARRVPVSARAAGHRVLSERREDGDRYVLLERGEG